MKKMFWIGLIILIVVFSFFMLTQNNKNKEESISVGAILPLTSWGSYWGEPCKKGMLLLKEEINDTNFNLIIEDTQSSNSNAVSSAHKLINNDGVNLIIVEFSGASNAVAPIAYENNITMIYDSFNPQILKKYPNTFKNYFDPYTEYKKLSEIVLNDENKNVAVFLAQLEFAEDVKKAIEDTKLNATYYYFNWDEEDFRTLLLKVKENNNDAIIGMGYESNFLNIFKQMKELGIDVPMYCGGRADCLTENIINSAEPNNKVVIFDYSLSKNFEKAFLSKFPDTTYYELVAGATCYDEVLYAYNAIKKCKNKNQKCIENNLLKLKLNGALKTSEGFNINRQYGIETRVLEYDPIKKEINLLN